MSAIDSAAQAAGRYLAGQPYRVALDTPFAMPLLTADRAIYLALSASGNLDYIGKVDRPNHNATGRRLSEHMRLSPRKRHAWRWLWVVPLTADITEAQVRALERALIIRHRPPGNVQHGRAA